MSINSSPSELLIEDLRNSDLPAVAALQPEGWQDIMPAFRFYVAHPEFCHPVKALLNNEVVGTGVAICHENVSWLAGIIVDPAHRNRGFGYQITKYLMDHFAPASGSILLIATPQGRPVYKKLGFIDEAKYNLFSKGKMDATESDNIVPFSEDFREDIYNLDLELSGEKRKKLLDIFMSKAVVYKDKGVIRGYFFPSMGEGMIYAATEEAGLALLRFRLREEKHSVIPEENKAAIEFMLQNGFKFDDSKIFYRMSYGAPVKWKADSVYSRAGGNFG